MNKEWHEQHMFPEKGTDSEKQTWREEHKKHCNCGRMVVPFRQTPRD